MNQECGHKATTLCRRLAVTREGVGTVAQRQCDGCLRGVGAVVQIPEDDLLRLPRWVDRRELEREGAA